MPSYEAEQRIKCQTADEMAAKIKELEKEIKRKDRELADEPPRGAEKVEMLKKCPQIFEVSKNIDSELCKRALANALALRGRHKGLVFHSDRGSQYSSRAYKSMLAENGIESSMSEPGCPYDNSCVEVFFRYAQKEMTQLQDGSCNCGENMLQ